MGTTGLAEAYYRETEMPGTDYEVFAGFHHHVCRFLEMSDKAARAYRLNRQQFLLMLVIKGLSQIERPTITTLANKLCLRPHSVVELVNRLVARGVAVRCASGKDQREVLVAFTPLGEEILQESKNSYFKELKALRPNLAASLERL